MHEVRVVGAGPCDTLESLERLLASAGVHLGEGDWWGSPRVAYRWQGEIRADDDRWRALRAASGDPLVTGRTRFTESDVRAAEMVMFDVSVDVTPKGETGPEHGNEYVYDEACSHCLSGAGLVPPFRMRGSDLPKKRPIATTYFGEVLVSGRTAARLREVPGSDSWLVPVQDRRSGGAIPWFLIQPTASLRRWHASTRGFSHDVGPMPGQACAVCQRDCHGGSLGHKDREGVLIIEPKQPVYQRAGVIAAYQPWIQRGESLPDVAKTWELHGVGSRPSLTSKKQLAQPFLIVGRRVANILLETLTWKWLDLAPVRMIE